MRSPHGYAVLTSPEAVTVNFDRLRCETLPSGVHEVDTFGCGHCGRVVHVKPRQRPEDLGGLCRQCMKPICPGCIPSGRCDPLEKKLEAMEKRDMALRSYGL